MKETKPSKQIGGTLSAVLNADSGSANVFKAERKFMDMSALSRLQSNSIKVEVKKEGNRVHNNDICSISNSLTAGGLPLDSPPAFEATGERIENICVR